MGIRKVIYIVIIFSVIVLFIPTAAHANVGLPVLIALPLSLLSWPTGLFAALVLVTILESIVLCCVLGLSIWFSALVAFAANLVSTAFGIFGLPIIFGILLGMLPWILLKSFSTEAVLLMLVSLLVVVRVGDQVFLSVERHEYDSRWKTLLAVTLFAPFLMVGGDEDGAEYYWMAPAVCLTFLVPCFFASWYIESFATNVILQSLEVATELVDYALFAANLVSYGVIALVLALWLVMELLGISLEDLLSAKRHFVAKLHGYRTVSGKPFRQQISSTYEPVRRGSHFGMDTPAGAEAKITVNLRSSKAKQLQKLDKPRNENELTVNSKEVTKAA